MKKQIEKLKRILEDKAKSKNNKLEREKKLAGKSQHWFSSWFDSFDSGVSSCHCGGDVGDVGDGGGGGDCGC